MKPRLNQKGQAVVEYVLLLVLAAAIMLAVTSALFKPLKKWTDFYLGTYTTCLLDYGVLPGNFNGTVSECQQQAIDSGLVSNASNTSGNKAENTANQAAANAAAKAEAARANAAARRGSQRSGTSYASSQGNAPVSTGRGVNESNISDGSGRKNIYTQRIVGNQRASRSDRVERIVPFRRSASLSNEDSDLARLGEAKISKVDSDLPPRASKRMPFRPPPPKISMDDTDDSNKFSIGNFFRLIIMALIILAVVYVVGTQINSISKSMDS